MTSTIKAILLTSLFLGILFYSQTDSIQSFLAPQISSGFTEDFKNFLSSSAYNDFAFERTDIKDGCFGGSQSRPSSAPKKIPVIFIHGNSDIAYGQIGNNTGARGVFEYLLSYEGYTKDQLFATTWGNGNANLAPLNYHSKSVIQYNHAFVKAVLEYTKSDKVHIVAHSMGVTISRKIIKGGQGYDALQGGYDLGEPLTKNVDVFIGLAGANQGLNACYLTPTLPTCGVTNGFYPGASAFSPRSTFLEELDSNKNREGALVVTMWSRQDDLIQAGCLVYGKYTPRISGQNSEIVYTSKSHFGVRDESSGDIAKIFASRG